MSKELKDIAIQFSNSDANEFVRKVLGLAVSEIAGEQHSVDYQVEVRTFKSRLYIEITTVPLPEDSPSAGIAVSFNSPKLREAPWFITALPQPCEKPIISFRRNEEMTQLEAVPFLSGFKEKKIDLEPRPWGDPDPIEFHVKVDGWTFPTNGVMFTWRYRKVADANSSSNASSRP